MNQTRVSVLLQIAVVVAVLGYVLAARAFGSVPFPSYGPAPVALLAVAELLIARVVRDRLRARVRGTAPGRPGPGKVLHPMQVARAAVLAKASSVTGAVVAGCYAGILVWTLPQRGVLASADRSAAVAGLTASASVLLVVAALVLERTCRLPEDPAVGSRA